jgi:hypothetical protein
MKKIPTIFVRGEGGKITDVPHPDCGWVFAGHGFATEKLDGTNVRLTVRAGRVVRIEKRRNPTREEKEEGLIDPWYVDSSTSNPADQWLIDASTNTDVSAWPEGEHSCEAIGPKIQSNPLGLQKHVCVPFNLRIPVYSLNTSYYDDPSVQWFDEFKHQLKKLKSLYAPGLYAEGIVFHHPDGRRAKITRRDFTGEKK